MGALKEEDVTKMLAATTHIGSTNTDFQMEQYIFKRRSDGVHIINIRRTYEKLLLAARAIVAIDNPADVFVISSRPEGQRAALKFASYTKSTPIAGRFTPGAFTNQIQAAFREPRLPIIIPLLKPVTSTSPSLLWPTLIRPCVTLILPFPATTRLPTRLVCCSTCWPVKCSVFVASSLAIWNGASWPTCSSTAILWTSKRRRKTSWNKLKLLSQSRLPLRNTSKKTGPNPPSRAPTGPMRLQHPLPLLLLPSLSLPVKTGPVLLLMIGAHLPLLPLANGVHLPPPTGLKKV